MLLVVSLLAVGAFASERYVHGRGSATDMDESRAHAEALDQAKDNLENACPSGRFVTAPQVTSNECHMAGPGSVTCTVVITATCETSEAE